LYRSCTASFELKDLKTRVDLALNEADHFSNADFSLLIGQLPRSAFLDRFRLAGQPARVNEFYKKECQEKNSPSTGGREDFGSRDPAHFTVRVPLDCARGFASELPSIPVAFIVRW
jgi:hypothetical protein